jgi:hypothetical protein
VIGKRYNRFLPRRNTFNGCISYEFPGKELCLYLGVGCICKMKRNKIAGLLSILWLANLVVGLLVVFTDLSVKPSGLFYLQLSIFVTGLPLINWYDKRTKGTRRLAIGSFIICNAAIVFFYVFLDGRGEWKTQTVEYQNLNLSNRTIEFQLQDKGARGYNRRRVDRMTILPFIEWIKVLEDAPIDALTWKKVDIYVNEMGLKGG